VSVEVILIGNVYRAYRDCKKQWVWCMVSKGCTIGVTALTVLQITERRETIWKDSKLF
jgi:hypothetical protein